MSGLARPELGTQKEEWGDYERPGDVHHAKFHDCCGVIVFIALFVVSIAFLITGVTQGRPWILTHSWDETGNFCGRDNGDLHGEVTNLGDFQLRDLRDTPFLLFGSGRPLIDLSTTLDIGVESPGERQYCVAACPTVDSLGGDPKTRYSEAFADTCADDTRICPPWFDQAARTAQSKKGGQCICPYPTDPMFGRCVPLADKDLIGEELIGNVTAIVTSLKNVLFALPGIGQGLTATIDLAGTIALWVALSFVIAFIWILLLRCAARVIVYAIAIFVPILIAGLGLWLWFYGQDSFLFKDEGNSHKICAGVCFGIAFIVAVLVLFLWSRLRNAVDIIGIAGQALWGNLTSLAAPLLSLLLLAVFWALSLTSAVFNYTSADFTIGNRTSAIPTVSNSTPFLTMTVDKDLQYVLIYILVYLIFISVHVYFTNYYAQSAAIVDWYFQGGPGGPCNCRCLYGFAMALTRGLGTIALCALIMTPVYVLILICEYLDEKSKENEDQIPVLVQFLIKCMKCCLYCFEKILRYLNKSLLTFSQIYNTGWWASAKLTLNVLLSDTVMVAIMNGIATFIIFLSKVVVAALATLFFFVHVNSEGKTSGWIIPAFIVFFLSFIVASFVLGMFTNMIDIVFVCYMSDQDLTGAGGQTSYYGDSGVRDTVNELKNSAGSAQVEGGDITKP